MIWFQWDHCSITTLVPVEVVSVASSSHGSKHEAIDKKYRNLRGFRGNYKKSQIHENVKDEYVDGSEIQLTS